VGVCANCGKELAGEFPFCPFCGTASTAAAAAPAAERKVVSVVFCDLVGFTAASELADPEDVQARLRPYHERVRDVFEHHGGSVEKFVGDAVMAVFGAPVAHEDDAERAVRAGLRIIEAIGELNDADASLGLQVRVGVNTGEAVVALGARPEFGEAMVTGDVVNTASRLQGAAPVDGVVVSEQTYRMTERVFEWEPLESVEVKGKAEPVAIWRPLAPRARFGSDVTRTHATPLVGRELEKQLLIGTFERAAQQQSCQLVTIVGEPGVGKSRLCMELFSYLEERPGLVRWRQGRCLSYGEGISFWALGEIVKAECGILESDTPEQAAAKLERTLPPQTLDRTWLLARLAPLVGAGGAPASQEESFTAWRRFLESLAAENPAVVVVEDLHWADPALLAFLEHLAGWAEGVPLLVLCTARPELYEQHATFGANARNSTRINLAPLSDDETGQLVSALLERAILPAETQQQLLERAGGNPLYAEEFVRLLADRGQDGEVPDTVQALIAARLDTLTPGRKALLQDAAVMGKTFWAGALAASGREQEEIEQALHELSRKELVRPNRSSSMQGEQEYSFWHGLVRDVCYQQIPRASRATRHQTAAGWLEDKASERVEDLADVLAYHYLTAIELTEAVDGSVESSLRERAVRYLGLAGERALGLDITKAQHNLARALQLAPDGDSQRVVLLERWARALELQGRLREAKAAFEEALNHHRQSGDRLGVGRTLTRLETVLGQLGDPRRYELLAEALTVLEAEPPGPDLVYAHGRQAGLLLTTSALAESIVSADKTLDLAVRLGLPQPADTLGYRGAARAYLGEHDGVAEMRRALELAIERGEGRNAAVLYNNLTVAAWLYEGPRAALDVVRAGTEFCQRRGLNLWTERFAGGQIPYLVELGQADEALTQAVTIADRLEQTGDINFIEPRAYQLHVHTERGEHDRAPAPQTILDASHESGDPAFIILAVSAAATLFIAQGFPEQARPLLTELDESASARTDLIYPTVLPGLVRSVLALGEHALASSLAEGVPSTIPRQQAALASVSAQLADAAGRPAQAATLYAAVAERWHQFGNVPERAYALLGQGRCLHALDDPAAEHCLSQARDAFAAIGYQPALAKTQSLLDPRELAAS
jgi:class 3 adenylate cyclase/tetratricopeptide (TPR) repeat protein